MPRTKKMPTHLSPEFLKRIKPQPPDLADGVELSSRPISIKLPTTIDAIVRGLDNRQIVLREIIARGLAECGYIDPTEVDQMFVPFDLPTDEPV